jgi:LysM repeat protein
MIILNRYRVSNKSRFKVFLITSIVLLILLTSMVTYTVKAYSYSEIKYIELQINSGDTIWDIAKEYGQTNSIREDVYEIMKFNDLPDGYIYPGQTIKVQVKE